MRHPGPPGCDSAAGRLGRHRGGCARRAAARRPPPRARPQPGTRGAARHGARPAAAACRPRPAGTRPMSSSLGVLLLTYGSPAGPDDMPRYLAAVRGGRPASAEVVTEFRRRYDAIGGSPLIPITEAQAAALEEELRRQGIDAHV